LKDYRQIRSYFYFRDVSRFAKIDIPICIANPQDGRGRRYSDVLRTGLNHAMLSAPKIRDTRLQFNEGAHQGWKAWRRNDEEETGDGGKVGMK